MCMPDAAYVAYMMRMEKEELLRRQQAAGTHVAAQAPRSRKPFSNRKVKKVEKQSEEL